MREIVLDTETTGLDPEAGDRIVEIGAVELVNHVATGRTFHAYINPDRTMPADAFEVHGLGDAFLADKPRFAEVAADFLAFVAADRLIIHNAEFDLRFLNAELQWMSRPPIPADRAVDTLAIARKRFPGAAASLDALCRRFGIDNSVRVRHGALLDSEILADVYLELIGGRQPDFGLTAEVRIDRPESTAWRPMPRPRALPPRITAAERAAHQAFVARLGEDPVWAAYGD